MTTPSELNRLAEANRRLRAKFDAELGADVTARIIAELEREAASKARADGGEND